MTAGLHRNAEKGFGLAADSYVKGRPDYPAEVDDWLTGELHLRPGAVVVDVGAGTGKFTRRLRATGARVIAVEPVRAMRDKLTAAMPDVETVDGTADALPLGDASADAIVCATAFHWFANPPSLAEMHRVLKPGGVLGLIWNVRDTRIDWVARLDALIESRAADSPRFHTGAWQRVFPYVGFGPLQSRQMAHVHRGDPQDVIVSRVRSSSVMASLSPEEWEPVAAELREMIDHEPGLLGQREVSMPYRTWAYHSEKTR